MTLSQELTTLEQISRLTLSDLEAAEANHDLSRQFREDLKAIMAEYTRTVSEKKLAALAFGR